MSQFSDQLTALRTAHGLTMADLADRAGVARMTVQRAEAGRDVRMQTVEDMLRVMGVEFMIVPSALRKEVEQFIRAEGKIVGQPVGIAAPLSIVDELRVRRRKA